MKRTIFLKVFTSIIFVLYAFLILYSIFFDFFFIYKYWFSSLILIFGISLFLRYLCYHIDSNLLSGLLLILSGIFGILNYYLKFNTTLIIAGYLLSLGLSFLAVFIKFRQIFHLKAFAFVFLYVIVLVIYSNDLMPPWLFISLLGIISIMMFLTIFERIKLNMRRI